MPVIQAQLNDFVRIWNIRKTLEHSWNIHVALDIISIDQHPICKNDEMHELFICYINIYKLEVPRDPEDAIIFYVKILKMFRAGWISNMKH